MMDMPPHIELAFWHYVHQGPDRSLRRAASELNRGVRTLEQWSARYQWAERLAEWQGRTAEVRARAHLVQATTQAVTEARDLAEEAVTVAARILAVVQARLDEPMAVGPENLNALLSAAQTAIEIAQQLGTVQAPDTGPARPLNISIVYEGDEDEQ